MPVTPILPDIDRSVSIEQISEISDRLTTMMAELREQMLAPRPRKKSPVFGSGQVALLCGIDRSRLNYLVGKEDIGLPPGVLHGNGRSRSFTLDEAQVWIRKLSGFPARPAGTPGQILITANFKGGSTKTTTAMSLAQGLTLRGRKVLVVDLDPQASLTELCGLYAERDVEEEDTVMPYIYHDQKDLRYAVKPTYWANLDVIPANPSLFSAEFVIPSYIINDPKLRFWEILANGLASLRHEYDYIVIDTAPSLSYLTINALMASNAMIMPLVPESLDFISSVQFWKLFSDLTQTFMKLDPGKRFDFISVLLSKVDYGTTSSSRVVRAWAQRAYGDWLLPVEIPASSVVGSEALEFATVYDIDSWEGSKKTLSRIKDPFDAFVKIIDERTAQKWSRS
ncbi:AAA family ATPase [Sulfuricystis multivorans]|uniref:AAA family ATPase n=1 Tax=Sulfuricystis multivorans TaxID=2211108 RepID=UPI000F84E374|nr:AAA family ATPase [Sulfuricystis multivorans]